jgi:hypothetical protein
LKQASLNWYEKLKDGMVSWGYQPCLSDPCVYTKDDIVVLVYVDNMLIFSRSMSKITAFIHSLEEEYEFTDEGYIKSYLGIDISKPHPGTYKLGQIHGPRCRFCRRLVQRNVSQTSKCPIQNRIRHQTIWMSDPVGQQVAD